MSNRKAVGWNHGDYQVFHDEADEYYYVQGLEDDKGVKIELQCLNQELAQKVALALNLGGVTAKIIK